MQERVYLIWTSFRKHKLFLIGMLDEKEDKYVFKFCEEAKDAEKEGCFLPFKYTDKKIEFNTLPPFFEQRMLKGEFNWKTFKLKKTDFSKLSLLVFNDSIKNSDNYKIVTRSRLEEIVKEKKDKNKVHAKCR